MEPVPAAVHVAVQGARGVGQDGSEGSSACGRVAALSGRLLCSHEMATREHNVCPFSALALDVGGERACFTFSLMSLMCKVVHEHNECKMRGGPCSLFAAAVLPGHELGARLLW